MLGYPEREVWRMTMYKIFTLFDIHKQYNPEKFGTHNTEDDRDPVDIALGIGGDDGD